MTLRDKEGEIDVAIGDMFHLRTGDQGQFLATMEALCINSRFSRADPVVWCRFDAGDLLLEGRRADVGDLLNCTGEVVAVGVRTYRKSSGYRVPVQPEQPEWSVKTPRAREAKERHKPEQPTTSESLPLFD